MYPLDPAHAGTEICNDLAHIFLGRNDLDFEYRLHQDGTGTTDRISYGHRGGDGICRLRCVFFIVCRINKDRHNIDHGVSCDRTNLEGFQSPLLCTLRVQLGKCLWFELVVELEAKLGTNAVTLELDDDARAWIAERGYDPKMGARPMARIIQEHIKRPLAEELLFGSLEKGGHVRITVGEDGDLQLVSEPVLKELEHLKE